MENFFSEPIHINRALDSVLEYGYAYRRNLLTEEAVKYLFNEAVTLSYVLEDRVSEPINKDTSVEVRQFVERTASGQKFPRAEEVAAELGSIVRSNLNLDRDWHFNEISYQRYPANKGFISPHRDSERDQILGATLCLSGNAKINFYLPKFGNNSLYPNKVDYKYLELYGDIESKPGTVMFLRAAGLGSGERLIHEVEKSKRSDRIVLNLRAKPS